MCPAVLAWVLGLMRGVFVAWYDTDLKSYQKERTETELERAFEEKIDTDYSILHESKFGEYMAKPMDKTEETEWQKLAKKKNAGEKIKEVSYLPNKSEFSLAFWSTLILKKNFSHYKNSVQNSAYV